MGDFDRADLYDYVKVIKRDDYGYSSDKMLDIWNAYNEADAKSKPKKIEYDFESIAQTLMQELEDNKISTAVLMKNENIAGWWAEETAKRKKAEEAKRKKLEELKVKAEEKRQRDDLLATLTPEQKRLLGIDKKKY